MNQIALVILFNHKYDKNIPILEELYAGRFSNIFFIVPFYTGDKENVIPVYGRSIFFQGYIAQGYNVFGKKSFKHFFFVADDMIINPAINENNYHEFFKLSDQSSFIPKLFPLHEVEKPWVGNFSAAFYQKKQKYIECETELPTVEEAKVKFSVQGITPRPLSRKELFGKTSLRIDSIANKARLLLRSAFFYKRKFPLPYPMAGSYSDICVVSGGSMKQFAHYCGVFAATALFAEVAIPTALILAAEKKICTEVDLEKKGRSFWQSEDAIFWESELSDVKWLDKTFTDIEDVLNNFPSDFIYIHPIKLSKWVKKKPLQESTK